MKTRNWLAFVSGFVLLMSQPAHAEEGVAVVKMVPAPPDHPSMLCWQVDYERPVETPGVEITLCYKYWDPNIDGDVPSKKVLGTYTWKKAPATASFQVSIDAKSSALTIDGMTIRWGGCPLDASFAVARLVKRNADGFYVLAQKPVDPKKPAAMGDTGDAAAWIELSIVPQS